MKTQQSCGVPGRTRNKVEPIHNDKGEEIGFRGKLSDFPTEKLHHQGRKPLADPFAEVRAWHLEGL